jgi:hypothetical protein
VVRLSDNKIEVATWWKLSASREGKRKLGGLRIQMKLDADLALAKLNDLRIGSLMATSLLDFC